MSVSDIQMGRVAAATAPHQNLGRPVLRYPNKTSGRSQTAVGGRPVDAQLQLARPSGRHDTQTHPIAGLAQLQFRLLLLGKRLAIKRFKL